MAEAPLADTVAEQVWRHLKPFKTMRYLELMNIASQVLDYTGGDVDKAVEILDRTIDPEATYHENIGLIEKSIGVKLRRDIPTELEKYEHEKKSWIREQAEALSITKEIEEKAAKPPVPVAVSMSKEEAFQYLKSLTPYAEKHREQFEAEWTAIEGLPVDRQRVTLRMLAREIEAKEVKPPEAKPKIPKVYKEWIEYVPEHKREFFRRWMEMTP